MAFNRKIKLFNQHKGYGTSTTMVVSDEKTVWCSVDTIGSINAIHALSVGLKFTNQIEMWKKEYNGQGYATLDGKDYKIETPAQSRNPLKIKLLLSRG